MPKRSGRAKKLLTADLTEHIRHRAYLLWLQEGQPEGRSEAHWELARQAIEETDEKLRGRVSEKKKSTVEKKHQKTEVAKGKGRPQSRTRSGARFPLYCMRVSPSC